MKRLRQMMAVALVATALCADRAASAAPAFRPQVGEMARQIAGRLAGSFRRVVAPARLDQARQERATDRVALGLVHLILPAAAIHPAELCEFYLRLPPPLL